MIKAKYKINNVLYILKKLNIWGEKIG